MADAYDGKVNLAVSVEAVDVNGTVKAISDAISKGVGDGAQLAKKELANLESDIIQNNRKVTERIAKGYVKAADAIKFGGTGNGAVIDKSAFEPIKLSLEEVKAFITQVSSAIASEVAPEFQRLTGDMHSVSEYASEFYNNINQSVGGAENFVHIIELMKLNMKDLTGFLDDFANTYRANVLGELQNTPLTNPMYLLEAGPESENLDAHWAKDMQKALSEVRIESKDVLEIMAQLGSYKSQFENASLIGEIPSNVISEYQSLMAYINEITAKYQEFAGYANKFSVLPDERLATVFNVSDINEYVALVNQLNNAYKVLNSSLTAVDSTYVDLQSRTEQYLAQQAEARQKAIDNFEITPEGDKIIDKEAYQNALAYKEALQQVVDKVKEVADAEKDLLSAQQYMADSKALPGTQKYADVQMSVDEATERLKVLRAELAKLRSQADAIKNPKKEPIIVDQAEYDRAKKLLDTLEQIKQKKAELESLKAKQSNNIATGNIQGTQEYANTAAEIHNVQSEIQSLEAELGILNDKSDQSGDKLQSVFSVFGSAISRVIPGFSGALNQVMNTVSSISGLFGDTAKSAETAGAGMENMSTSASGLASALGTVAAAIGGVIAGLIFAYQYSKKAEAMGKQFVSNLISTIQNGFQKAISVVKQFGSAIASVLNKANSLLSKFGGGIKSFFTSLFKQNSRSALSFKRLFNLVVKYGFGVRSTYMLFRKFRTMVTEGFKSMAQYADRFNGAMTTITSSWNQLKGQVSAILEPIITRFAPFIDDIITKLNEAALAVTKFMGAIMGFKQVLKATKVIKDYANAVGSANKQLAGFDELNNLTSDSGSGADDFGNGWEWVDTELPDFWEQMRAEWEKENPDFSFLGRTIADKLSEVMENIPWENIFNKAYKGGFSFSTFLNGFFTDDGGDVSTRFFDDISNTISNGLNTVTYAVQGVIDGFKFSEFGKALGSGFVSLTNAIDWFTISDNIVNGVDGVLTTVSKFIGTVFGEGGTDFMLIESTIMSTIDGLITDVTKFLRTTDFDSVLNTASKLIRHGVTDLINIAYAHIDDVDWQGLGQKLGANLSTLFYDVDWAKLGDTIGQGLINALDFAKGFLQWADLSGIVDNVVTVISNINWSEVGTEFGAVLNALGEEFADIAASAYASVEDNPLYKFFHSMFSEANITAILHNVIATVGNLSIDLVELLGGIISDIFDPENGIDFADLGSILGDAVTQILANIHDVLSSNKDNIIKGIQAFLNELDLQQIASDIVHIIKLLFEIAEKSGLVAEISAFLMTIGSNLKTELFKMNFIKFFESLGAKADAGIKALEKILTDKFGEAGKSILRGIAAGIIGGLTSILFGPFVGLVAAIIGWFCNPLGIHSPSTVFEGFGINLIEGLVNGITSMLENIRQVFTEITTFITETATEWLNLVTSKATEIKTNLSVTWETIKTNIVTKFAEMKDSIAEKLTLWKSTVTEKVELIKSTFTTTFEDMKNSVVDIFTNMWDKLKTPLNFIIGGVESMANHVIDGINAAIKAVNGLQFTMPDWIPIVGGKSLGFTIPSLPQISIPKLAQGAVIPPNKEFMAVLGDQKHGTNIETPLETMLEAFNMALDQNSSDEQIISLMQTQIQLLQAIANKRFGHTDKEIFDSVVKTENEQYKISGKHLLAR